MSAAARLPHFPRPTRVDPVAAHRMRLEAMTFDDHDSRSGSLAVVEALNASGFTKNMAVMIAKKAGEERHVSDYLAKQRGATKALAKRDAEDDDDLRLRTVCR